MVWKPVASLAPGAAGVATGSACLMGLRPEALSIGTSGEGGLPGRVAAIEFVGGDRLVHVEVGGSQLTVRMSAEQPIGGPEILLFPPQETPLLFDANSGMRLNPAF